MVVGFAVEGHNYFSSRLFKLGGGWLFVRGGGVSVVYCCAFYHVLLLVAEPHNNNGTNGYCPPAISTSSKHETMASQEEGLRIEV